MNIIFDRFVQNTKIQVALEKLSMMPNIEDVKKNLTLADLNKILYCCDGEDGNVYSIPHFSPFVYCGLQGNNRETKQKLKNCHYRILNITKLSFT